MSTEAKRSLLRILANYTRLVATLVLGLFLVRILLQAVGNDGQGLILLLGSTVGLAAMFQEIIRNSLVRELGAAYHTDDPEIFRRTLGAASWVSGCMALVGLLLFTGVYLALPWLSITPELLPAARWFLIARAFESTLNVLLAPQFNMLLIKERMFIFHLYTIIERSIYVLAALAVLWWAPDDPVGGVIKFGWLTAVPVTLVYFAFVGWLIVRDRSLIPSPRAATRGEIREIVVIGGWNTCVTAAINLHFRLDALLMNLAFGLFGNLVFGLAVQLVSYVRMIAQGMTFGVDAVATRHASTTGDNAVRRFNRQSTLLHALVTFPAAAAVLILCEPLLALWLEGKIDNPDQTLPTTAGIIRILMIGVVCRSITESWMRVLYGAGHIRRYAFIIILSGLANPVLAISLLWLFPDPVRVYAVSWAYAATLLIFNAGWLSVAASRIFGIGWLEVYRPLVRPLVGTIAAVPVLVVSRLWVQDWGLVQLAAALAVYGAVYAMIALFFVMDDQEAPARIKSLLLKRPDLEGP